MRGRLWTSLVGIVVATIALLVYNGIQGNEPELGLDLQGGASAVLEPVEPADREDLEFVAELVRDAVDSLGIAEPDVRVEGNTIVVDLPGVEDRQKALDLVNVSGEVSLHPVLQCADPEAQTEGTTPPASPASSTAGSAATSASTATTGPIPTIGTGSGPTSAPAVGTTATASATLATAAGWAAPDTTVPGDRDPASTTEPSSPSTSDTSDAPATTTPASSPATSAPASTGPPPTPAPTTTLPFFVATTVAPEPSYPVTNPDGTLIMENREGGICLVGPAGASGQVFQRKSADAVIIEGAWSVSVNLSGEGVGSWNALAAECNAGSGSCPTRQLAIALDGEIVSAPVVQQPSFADEVSITGDFRESEARDLAAVLNRGAYPFQVEPQTVQEVSASSGEEALRAVLIAGAIGIALVLAFMLVYYKALAAVMLAGLILSAAILFGVISLLSAQRNLTLTIAGAAGIILSVGVTVDSYVVFFERLKDEVRHGRSLRNSAARGFTASWRTILNGNLASLIGAVVLFWLSVGSVRGFAFFLAITTIIDMVVAYMFTRPAVLLLARSGRVGATRVFGIDTASGPTGPGNS